MLGKIIDQGNYLLCGLAGSSLVITMTGLPSHADLVGWTGTILSIATAFTGGFVMIYQRIQRARRDDRIEWMKIEKQSLQTLLEEGNRELDEARDEIFILTAKVATVTKQNGDQLEQIIELTRHITRLGAIIGRLPQRLGLRFPLASSEVPEKSAEALGQTVHCLEGLVEQLQETTQVLSRLAAIELERTASVPPQTPDPDGFDQGLLDPLPTRTPEPQPNATSNNPTPSDHDDIQH